MKPSGVRPPSSSAADVHTATGEAPSGQASETAKSRIPSLTAARQAQTLAGFQKPGAASRLPELVAARLVDDAASPWSAISACVGAPSCQSSLIDTRAYATALAQSGSSLPRTHISGCERRCGAPAGDHQDLVAPDLLDLLTLAGEVR